MSADAKRNVDAASAPSAQRGLGWSAEFARSVTAAAGTTIRFGMILRSKSTADTVTSARQTNAATKASPENPNLRKQPATSTPVTSSTRKYRTEIEVPHARHLPRSRSHEKSGMLSYHAISCPQSMHADGGLTIDRLSGTRAARTLRKLPNASPGAKAMKASAKSTATGSPVDN